MSNRLLALLPALYQTDPFIGEFLLPFERILLGRVEADKVDFPDRGLEETIAELATYFDPQHTPKEFLSWLAGWAALSLRADLPEKNQREFIANIIQRYRYRGTKANLQELLKLFLVGMPEVIETEAAHSFRVRVSFPRPAPSEDARRALGRQIDIARSIVDLEKPAHTAYDRVEPVFPSMQIGELSTRRGFSTIGVDTLLGVVPIDERSLQSQSSQANASEISTDASSETNTTPEINPFTPNIEANMSPDTNPSDDATTNL